MNRLLCISIAAASILFGSMPARPATGLEGVRSFDHIVLLVLENQNYNTSWGTNSVAIYLNSLRSRGVFADQYHATSHASLGNYITMISGQPGMPHSNADCIPLNLWACVQPQTAFMLGRNLADQLEAAGKTWKGYMDSMPSPCFHADYSPTALPPDPYQGNSTDEPGKDYADRHNPFLYFDNIIGNDVRCRAHVRPFTELAGDVSADALPAFSFVTPDTCNDGHDAPCADGRPGGLTSADLFLSTNVPSLLDYLDTHNGLLLITFDENGFSDTSSIGCCHGGPLGLQGYGGRIGLLALGAGVGTKVVSTPYDHMSLLRTIEDSFGINEYLNNAALSVPMADVFS
jgi:phosphatidylinositol-3-phosphatase